MTKSMTPNAADLYNRPTKSAKNVVPNVEPMPTQQAVVNDNSAETVTTHPEGFPTQTSSTMGGGSNGQRVISHLINKHGVEDSNAKR